jgi:hypothetical protein
MFSVAWFGLKPFFLRCGPGCILYPQDNVTLTQTNFQVLRVWSRAQFHHLGQSRRRGICASLPSGPRCPGYPIRLGVCERLRADLCREGDVLGKMAEDDLAHA